MYSGSTARNPDRMHEELKSSYETFLLPCRSWLSLVSSLSKVKCTKRLSYLGHFGVKLGTLPLQRNAHFGCLRAGCSRLYTELREGETERERESVYNGKTDRIIQEQSYIALLSSYIRLKWQNTEIFLAKVFKKYICIVYFMCGTNRPQGLNSLPYNGYWVIPWV